MSASFRRIKSECKTPDCTALLRGAVFINGRYNITWK